jgi:hypothetical protein
LETQKKELAKNPFLLSSKRSSDAFALVEKEKPLASTEKQHSISA